MNRGNLNALPRNHSNQALPGLFRLTGPKQDARADLGGCWPACPRVGRLPRVSIAVCEKQEPIPAASKLPLYCDLEGWYQASGVDTANYGHRSSTALIGNDHL